MMAPIDPNQLLLAFAPLLTPSGGIKNATEVPRLSSLMTKFSRKLVSRCVYCNVLLATSPDVLEEFLKSGGWKTIDQWIQTAKELGNKAFLNELCELLIKLPMTVERLREENIKTPKIINKLSKSDDPILAPKAKKIVEQWKKMIETASGLSTVGKEHNHKDGKGLKKRKKDSIDSKDIASGDPQDGNYIKRTKNNSKTENFDFNSNSNTDSSLSFDSINDESSKSRSERTPRPSTAKVKPGKSRIGALFTSPTDSKAIKLRKESANAPNIKKLISNSNKTTNSSNSELQNSLSNSSTTKVKPQAIDIKSVNSTTAIPLTPTTPVPIITAPPPPPPPAVKHVLQDSTSFMDALIAPPTPVISKKKRRLSAQNSSKEGNSSGEQLNNQSGSSPKGSPTKPFSFYKDMIDEKVDQRVADSDSNPIDDNEDNDVFICDTNSEDKQNSDSNSGDLDEERTHMNVDIIVPVISVDPSNSLTGLSSVISDRSSQKIKPILCYVKKGVKKSVRWVEDSRIKAVRFFELDETERVNVTRPAGTAGYGDLKRYDMKHEAEFMLMARKANSALEIPDDYMNRSEAYGPWKLVPCDGDTNLVEVGKDSKERAIQADRMRTTLETFYLRNQVPDSPQEPESEIFIGDDQPKVIPLEDDNNPNNCHDFSNVDLPRPKTGEILPPRIPDLSTTVPISVNNYSPRMPFSGPSNAQGMVLQSGFPSGQPVAVIPPFNPNLDPFQAPPQQQFFPPNNGPPPFQQWSDGNTGGPSPQHPGPPPGHFVQHFNAGPRGPMGSRPPRLPRNANNTVCRHFARTGKCRYQPKCNFLHTNDR